MKNLRWPKKVDQDLYAAIYRALMSVPLPAAKSAEAYREHGAKQREAVRKIHPPAGEQFFRIYNYLSDSNSIPANFARFLAAAK